MDEKFLLKKILILFLKMFEKKTKFEKKNFEKNPPKMNLTLLGCTKIKILHKSCGFILRAGF